MSVTTQPPRSAEEGSKAIAATGKKTERDLVQLVYVSSAAPALTPADLEAIAESSRVQNESSGLTGLLLHQGRSFYGVLEGPQRRVFQRMESIISDRRHFGLRILREEAIPRRRFENWTFGVLPTSAKTTDLREGREEFIWSLARRLK